MQTEELNELLQTDQYDLCSLSSPYQDASRQIYIYF